jgi:hypothetical protein
LGRRVRATISPFWLDRACPDAQFGRDLANADAAGPQGAPDRRFARRLDFAPAKRLPWASEDGIAALAYHGSLKFDEYTHHLI